MILQALKEYYDRRKESDPTIATYGWEWKQIPYLIVLNDEGDVVDLVSTYEVEGKKKEAKSFLLPQGVKRSSGVAANLLWDNLEYVLGVSVETDGSITQTDKNEEKNKAFCAQLNKLDNINDQGVNAVRKFLDKSLEERINSLARFPVWEELKKDKKALITFRLDGYSNTVADSSLVRNAVNSILGDVNAPVRRCLVTNSEAPVARLHQSIKGVWGGNATGTNIVGFNLPPFCSYGKKQGENAPVSEVAVFEYTTALNMLLEKGSANRFQVGEASTVAWGEKNNKLETAIHVIFENSPEDNPDQGVNAVKQLYESVRSGAWTEDEQKGRFYILGLSPNAARLAIRFWQVSTVKEAAESILLYFDDIKIDHGPKEAEYLSLFRILTSIAVQGKKENIPPLLAGGVMRAIFDRTPFSNALLQAAIQRNRAEQKVTYPRASIIKACLNRAVRFYNKNEEELKVSLDQSNTNIGYRLGRLFAVLEKIQERANPGLNSTIRDRYYGSASGTPGTVFPSLMRLKNHHLSKMDNRGFFESLLGEIISEISDFPRFLTLEDQGRFAIGYYHQRQDFYTKKEVRDADEKEDREQNNEAPLLEYGS